MKKNCWEFKKCGREPGGFNDNETSRCLVPLLSMYDGINNGTNGGRVCWIVSGSICEGEMLMAFSDKIKSCKACDFYHTVLVEEGESMPLSLKALQDLVSRIKTE